MKRKSIVFSVVVVLISAFIGLTQPLAVHAACATYSGSHLSNVTPISSPIFSVSAGDTVTASHISSGAPVTNVSIEITINGHLFGPFGTGSASSASGSAPVDANGTGQVFFANQNTGTDPTATMNWTVTVGKDCFGGVNQLTFTDGRMNSHDGQQTAAVYCNEDDGVDVWAVYNSQGYFAFTATKADLAKVPEKPIRNTLIKSRLGVSLYRLTT